MRLICQTSEQNGLDDRTACDMTYAVLEADDALIKMLRFWQNHTETFCRHLKGAALAELYVWDSHPSYYGDDLGERLELLYPDVYRTCQGVWTMLPDAFPLLDFQEARTECDQLVITTTPRPGHDKEIEFGWSTIPKHGSVYVTTDKFRLVRLEIEYEEYQATKT